MTDNEKTAIKCAHADLVGAREDYVEGCGHDWDAHEQTIKDLQNAFDFIHVHKEYKD